MTTVAWMWGDTDPASWSDWKSIAATADELHACKPQDRSRPVLVSEASASGGRIERKHANVASAMAHIIAMELEQELSLDQAASVYSTGCGGEPKNLIKKALVPLEQLEQMFDGEQCPVQARKLLLAARFNADAELHGKSSSLHAKVDGVDSASSEIKINDNAVTPEHSSDCFGRGDELSQENVSSGKSSKGECKDAVKCPEAAKTLADKSRCKVVGKAALVAVAVSVSTTAVVTLFTICLEAYRKCEDTSTLVKLRAGFGALATSDAWIQMAKAVGTAGTVGLVTGLLGGFAEALTDYAHIFQGVSYSLMGIAIVGIVMYKGKQIYQRTDLCLSQKWVEFVKEMGLLGLGCLGGMAGATAGAALLAGIPGMVLGGVLGCIFGTLLGNAWTWCVTGLSNCMQLGDRGALAEVGFTQTQLPIFRIFFGGSWKGDEDTNLILRVLSNTSAASTLDIEKARKALNTSYRRKALRVHPDQGGSHDSFIKLERAHKALLRRLESQPAASHAGPMGLPSHD